MHILFLTHYFPPEVNAPASRTFENARRWVQAGHRVSVITCAPNHPNGILYPGYKNRLHQWQDMDGIRVLRVKTYLSPNKGFQRRTLNYVSYMLSATLFSPLVRDVDVVVSTSPQFFCGMAGLWVSRLKRRPWILEIRDLWPESIVTVGAIKSRRIIRRLEHLETFLYRKAMHIVAVTHSFKDHMVNRGILPQKITVLTNGADLNKFQPQTMNNNIRVELGLNGKFVLSYIGTHGMAHHLETVLEAAHLLRKQNQFTFLLIGDGAEREKLLQRKDALNLKNVIMLSQQPKELMPAYIAASDACMVLLKKSDLFKTVIPSKIFEAMAMERPVILGVEGESKGIIETANCGICIEPENSHALIDAANYLFRNPDIVSRLGTNGRQSVIENYDRDILAIKYLDLLKVVAV
jgi:glycosyltransferase involved in cell wall biosynthesis